MISNSILVFLILVLHIHLYLVCFARYADVPITSLNVHVTISTPMGDCQLIDHVYKSCVIRLYDRDA